MWYYSVDGQTLGPLSEADLDQQVRSGALPPTVFIWREGMSDWQPYNQLRSVAAPAGLRVAAAPARAVIPNDPPFAEPEAEPMVQGSTRIESMSSWGMVVVVLFAMFLFIGMLASRSHAENGSGRDSAAKADGLQPRLRIRQGNLHVSNGASFDWPLTVLMLTTKSGSYAYKLDGLEQGESVTIPLRDFSASSGEKFDGVISGSVDISVNASGYPPSRMRFTKR